MACMCGDTACPSCGPAQGCDFELEMIYEWLSAVLDSENGVLKRLYSSDTMIDDLVNCFGSSKWVSDKTRESMVQDAKAYLHSEEERKRLERMKRFEAFILSI